MSYSGQVATIQLGQGGLRTDDPQSQIPANALISAINVSYRPQLLEKEPGSARWNKRGAIPGGIAAFKEVYFQEINRRVFVVSKLGKVYKYIDPNNYIEITPVGAAPVSLNVTGQPVIVQGGRESSTKPDKIFILTGNDQIQVISGDGTTRSNIALPAADWPNGSTSYPSFGIIHRGRLFVMGSSLKNPHFLYASDDDSHEDFQNTDIYFENIYPGEGEVLFSAVVFKSRLFTFKRPRGVYFLNDDNVSKAQWFSQKLSGTFGSAAPFAAVQVLDDLLVANSEGGVTSMQAVQALGDIESSDLFSLLKCSSAIRDQLTPFGFRERWSYFYPDKQIVYFSYRSQGGSTNDRLVTIDYSIRNSPRVSITDKNMPACLSFISDDLRVQRPFYGADDGYLYSLDSADREVKTLEAPPDSPSAALAGLGAGNLSAGTYRYRTTFGDSTRETDGGFISAAVTVANPAANGQVAVTDIIVDPTGTATKRKLYRTKASDISQYYLVTTINNNTTTTFTDNVSDASLGAIVPTINQFASAYRFEFQTPHMDFGYMNAVFAEQMKLFDFLEISFESSGTWQMSVDVFIDGELKETIQFQTSHGSVLDTLVLDTDTIAGRIPTSLRKPLHGIGRRISFKCYNVGQGQNVKIQSLNVYFRISAQQQIALKP
jgi:hypothetical protein